MKGTIIHIPGMGHDSEKKIIICLHSKSEIEDTQLTWIVFFTGKTNIVYDWRNSMILIQNGKGNFSMRKQCRPTTTNNRPIVNLSNKIWFTYDILLIDVHQHTSYLFINFCKSFINFAEIGRNAYSSHYADGIDIFQRRIFIILSMLNMNMFSPLCMRYILRHLAILNTAD